MRKKLLLTTTIVAATLMLAGCTNAPSEKPQANPADKTIGFNDPIEMSGLPEWDVKKIVLPEGWVAGDEVINPETGASTFDGAKNVNTILGHNAENTCYISANITSTITEYITSDSEFLSKKAIYDTALNTNNTITEEDTLKVGSDKGNIMLSTGSTMLSTILYSDSGIQNGEGLSVGFVANRIFTNPNSEPENGSQSFPTITIVYGCDAETNVDRAEWETIIKGLQLVIK